MTASLDPDLRDLHFHTRLFHGMGFEIRAQRSNDCARGLLTCRALSVDRQAGHAGANCTGVAADSRCQWTEIPEALRHSSASMTLNIYTHVVDASHRRQSKRQPLRPVVRSSLQA